jgi:hypothetical protein
MEKSKMKEVTVYRTWDESMACMAVDLLQGEGIHARIQANMRSVYPFTMDGLGEIDILVPEVEEDLATEILNVRFSGEGIIEDSPEGDLGWDGCRDSDEEEDKKE